jgi:hypothetical protein
MKNHEIVEKEEFKNCSYPAIFTEFLLLKNIFILTLFIFNQKGQNWKNNQFSDDGNIITI